MSLTPQQERFAIEVASGKTQADAYRAAYPKSQSLKDKSVHEMASKLMSNIKVLSRVKELQAASAERACLDAAQIKEEIRRLAHSDIAGIIDPVTGKVKLPHELDTVTRSAVASFKIDEYGRIEYKFWPKNQALSDAAKILGLFKEDNRQKTDPVSALAAVVLGGVMGVIHEAGPDEEDGE